MRSMEAAIPLVLAYGAGCISFALLVGRARGVDIRAHGSGNPGATNVGRVLGPGWGRLVLTLDLLKGLLPALLLPPVAFAVDPVGRTPLVAAAVLGHVFPATSGFRGGKGVATLVGGLLALDPVLALVSVAVHVVVKRGLGVVSMASIALAWSFPAAQGAVVALGWGAGRYTHGVVVMVALALLITVRHADNIRRMREGTEDRYDDGSEADGAS